MLCGIPSEYDSVLVLERSGGGGGMSCQFMTWKCG